MISLKYCQSVATELQEGNHNGNGRPSKTRQNQISQTLRTYFERGMTATFAANITGINVKTVCNYFNGWSEEIAKSEEQRMFSRQKHDRIRNVLSFDSLINEQYNLLKEIEEEINKYKKENDKVPIYFWQTRITILKAISIAMEKRSVYGTKFSSLDPL